MSTLKVNNLQVGQDSTATNNLTWFQPGSPDGTIRLGSGNAGSATTKFTFDKDGNLTCVGDITANSIIAPIEGTLDDWIVHDGDTNTKFGFPAADTFQVETGGANRLKIDANGVVQVTRRLELTNSSDNHHVYEGRSWTWTSNGTGSGTVRAYMYGDSAGALRVGTGGWNQRLKILSGGVVLIGNDTSQEVYGTNTVQIQGTSGPTSSLSLLRHGNSPYLVLGSSGGSALNAVTALSANNRIGQITFAGADGNDINTHSASIAAYVDGSVSTNAVPGRIVFATSTGATELERMRISSTGTVRIKRAVSTSLGNDSIFLGIGDTENGTNVNRMIGFGYVATFGTSVYPASMGYTESDNSGNTKGALVFNTRNTTGATDVPTERLRITSDGHVRIQHSTTNAKIILSRNVSVGTDDVSTGVLDFANNTAHTVNSRIMGKTSGTGNVGGQLVVETRDESTSSLTEKIRIKSNGKVGLGHHSASQITHELTIRPANNGGISIKRPGDTISNPNIHLDITTTAAGSAFPSGEAYTVKYKSMNCDQIFETYAGGGTGGNISFRTNTSNNSNETLRITKNGTVAIGGNYGQTGNALYVQGSPGIKVQGGSGGDGNKVLLELKHANTHSSGGAGDGPAMLFNGYYSNAEWAFAKICSVNSGSGYGADFQIHVHPANGSQGASLVKALSIVGDGASGADVMLPDGNIKFAQGHGVSFINAADVASGETVASSVLDDYEEGTYTPTISNLGNHSASSNTEGTYTKIGDTVTVRFRYFWTGRSTTNGAYSVTVSLPFTGSSIQHPGGGYLAVEGCQPHSSDRTSYHCTVPQSQAYVLFRCSGANVSENSFNGAISTSLNNGYFIGVVSYKTT